MKIGKKRQLAAKVLGVGKSRIWFNGANLPEIKEAITKQDIKDLHSQGIIKIKPVKGRKKIEKRKTKKMLGKIKIKVKRRKHEYMMITRKLRGYIKELKRQGRISKKDYSELRKKIRARLFKSKFQLKECLGEQVK